MRHPLTSGVALAAVLALSLSACGGSSEGSKASITEGAPLEITVDKLPELIYEKSVDISGTVTPGATVTIEGEGDDVITPEVSPDGNWKSTVRAPEIGFNFYRVVVSKEGHEDDYRGVGVDRADEQAQAARVKRERRAELKRRATEAKRRAQEVRKYKSSARTIPYNQLTKNADRYAGDRVKFTGQIFQIQEDGDDGGMMLLAVTDEGYDIWTDNVWVNYDRSIKSAEDDIVTVYGEIDGSRSYDTQIGGETYVPEMTAEYIEE